MKNKKKLEQMLGALDTGAYESTAGENVRTLEAVLEKTAAQGQAKPYGRRKRLPALIAAAALVGALSITAGAAALISSMHIEAGNGGFKNAIFSGFDTFLHGEATLVPKTLLEDAKNDIPKIRQDGGKRYWTLDEMEKQLGINFLQSGLLQYNAHLDDGLQSPIILMYFEGEDKKITGNVDASFLLKTNTAVDINCRATFAVDEPNTVNSFYLSDDKTKADVKVVDYTSPKNGLTAQISLYDAEEFSSGEDEVGLHFVYDDVAYDIGLLFFNGIDEGEKIAKDILDSFVIN